MNSRTNPARPRHGFTLVELLVVILIIAVLALLAFMGTTLFVKKAAAARDSSTLRQISTCINMYASDNNDYLPGPLFTGQAPVYNKPLSTNIKEWRRLADCFAPYMGYDNPKSGDFIEPMASSWQKDPVSRNAPAYYMQQKLPLGESGIIFQCPWGKPAPAVSDERTPMKLQTVLAQPKTSRTWAMTEVDQTHPDIGNPDWKSKTPPGMIHGNYRLALYFDGTVGKLDKNNNPL
jgi:prepilin-type N-terminal cleavage/methylation domain-containing protein